MEPVSRSRERHIEKPPFLLDVGTYSGEDAVFDAGEDNRAVFETLRRVDRLNHDSFGRARFPLLEEMPRSKNLPVVPEEDCDRAVVRLCADFHYDAEFGIRV